MKGKVYVAISGGVDSSVAAFLLKEKGYDCTGITLKMFDGNDKQVFDEPVVSDSDITDAKSICTKLEIFFGRCSQPLHCVQQKNQIQQGT